MGGSALAQVFGKLVVEAPDVLMLKCSEDFYDYQSLHESGIVLTYHDRSDVSSQLSSR